MIETTRNINVESAASLILEKVDAFIGGKKLRALPKAEVRNRVDAFMSKPGGSVRLASVFLLAYSTVDTAWDFSSVPVGVRGKYGDKRLSAELSDKFVGFHENITAFGENLGWKGNVKAFNLSTDKRFSEFLNFLKEFNTEERRVILDYVCSKIAETRYIPAALPALPPNYLTYSKAVALMTELLQAPSEGHIQQFLIAAILRTHRSRHGILVITHHPHASDKFDGTCGDIEELHEDRLINAYEVTVRDDWKNRIPDLREKMARGRLKKYVLIAAGVNKDQPVYNPSELVNFTKKAGFDLAIVDIEDFIRVFCAELTAEEIVSVVNTCNSFLCDKKLSGRPEFMRLFKSIVDNWIDSTS